MVSTPFPISRVSNSLGISFIFSSSATAYPSVNLNNFKKLKAIGVNYARFMPNWEIVEKVKGVYDFSRVDALVNDIRAVNIIPIIVLGISNINYGANYRIKPENIPYFVKYVGGHWQKSIKIFLLYGKYGMNRIFLLFGNLM